jgi:hypothetical protein
LQRGLERRLARAEAGAERLAALRDAEREREAAARFHDEFAEAIRAGLLRAGLDPADAACLHRQAEPDPPARPAPSVEDDSAAWLEAKFARLIECAREEPPNLAQASMAELFAVYCLAEDDDVSPSPPIGGRGSG